MGCTVCGEERGPGACADCVRSAVEVSASVIREHSEYRATIAALKEELRQAKEENERLRKAAGQCADYIIPWLVGYYISDGQSKGIPADDVRAFRPTYLRISELLRAALTEKRDG